MGEEEGGLIFARLFSAESLFLVVGLRADGCRRLI